MRDGLDGFQLKKQDRKLFQQTVTWTNGNKHLNIRNLVTSLCPEILKSVQIGRLEDSIPS